MKFQAEYLSSFCLNFRLSVLLLLCLVSLLTSCVIQKRHYRDGYYIDFKHSNCVNAPGHASEIKSTGSDFAQGPMITAPLCDTVSAEILSGTNAEFIEPASTHGTVINVNTGVNEPAAISASFPKDELPPDVDRPNKNIFWLMFVAVLFAACTAGILFSPVSVVFFILPLLGVLLFIAALYLRREALTRLIAGEKIQMSKFYPNFALALYLLFGAVSATFIGLAFMNSAVNIVGVVLFQGGIIVAGAALLILFILSLFWLCKWRVRGEGRMKPWEPRPKDP